MVEHGDPRCWELGGTRVSRAAFTAIVMILRHSWAIILLALSAGWLAGEKVLGVVQSG